MTTFELGNSLEDCAESYFAHNSSTHSIDLYVADVCALKAIQEKNHHS